MRQVINVFIAYSSLTWNFLVDFSNILLILSAHIKAVNRGDKRIRRVRDRDFVKFERYRRYRVRYHCQEKKSRRGRARDLVFRDPPTSRTRARSLFAVRDSPPPYA